MVRAKIYDEVISEILLELDMEKAHYQNTYMKLYGKEDNQAKIIYSLLTELCTKIRKEISVRERKK